MLHIAAMYSREDVVKLLLNKRGVDPFSTGGVSTQTKNKNANPNCFFPQREFPHGKLASREMQVEYDKTFVIFLGNRVQVGLEIPWKLKIK